MWVNFNCMQLTTGIFINSNYGFCHSFSCFTLSPSSPHHSIPPDTTPPHPTLIHPIPHYSTPPHTNPPHPTLLHPTPHYSTPPLHTTSLHPPHHSTPHHFTPPHHISPHHSTHHTTPSHTIPSHTTPFHTTPPTHPTPLHSTRPHTTHSTPPHTTPHYRFCILSFACGCGYCKSVVLIVVDKLLKLTLSFYFICLLLFYLFIVIICGRHCYFICLLLLFVADIVSWFDLFIVITCGRHCYFIWFVYCYYLWQTLMSAVAGWPTVPTRVTTQLEASSAPAPSAWCWTMTDRPA